MLTFSRKVKGIEPTGRNSAQNLADRARKYIEKMAPAVSGSGGHDALFAVASTLIHGFDLPEGDAWQILLEYNARCVPPWSEHELRHKLTSANRLSRHPKPRGHLRGVDVQPKYLPATPEKPKRAEWEVKPEPLPSKKFQALLSDTVEPPKMLGPTTQPASLDPVPIPVTAPADTAEDIEAKQIARELSKLHRDGAINGPNDIKAVFYACVFRDFAATYSRRMEE